MGLRALMVAAVLVCLAFPAYGGERSTEHFDIVWTAGSGTTSTEVETVARAAERMFGQLARFLGPERTPKGRLRLVLDGNGMKPGKFELPNVNDEGVTTLYRFPGPGGVYEASLLHELVHAFRYATMPGKRHRGGPDDFGFGFVEEAFAEHVALSIDPLEIGFSLYRYPLDVVAGHFLTTGPELDLTALATNHALNRPCVAQAYPLRASFFKYLEAAYGRSRVIELAYSPNITFATYQRLFGPFGKLKQAWRVWALRRFHALSGGRRLAHEYATRTPVQYFPLCAYDGTRVAKPRPR